MINNTSHCTCIFCCIILGQIHGSIGDSRDYSHEQNMSTILTSSYTSCAHEQKAMHYVYTLDYVGTVHSRGYDG